MTLKRHQVSELSAAIQHINDKEFNHFVVLYLANVINKINPFLQDFQLYKEALDGRTVADGKETLTPEAVKQMRAYLDEEVEVDIKPEIPIENLLIVPNKIGPIVLSALTPLIINQ